MPIHDLYSKRQKKIRGEVPDVFQYENFSDPFRWQVMYILMDLFPEKEGEEYFKRIHNILCREYGLNKLKENLASYKDIMQSFLLSCEDTEALDIIECSFNLVQEDINMVQGKINSFNPNGDEYKFRKQQIEKRTEQFHNLINEMNERFLEHGIGYQFESNEIIRVDSKFIHSEVVKSALRILTGDMYKGANDEFLKAHEHYRHSRHKECLNECLKSFESTMKAICTKRGWTYSDKDTANKLIEICFQNNLIPDYLQSQFTSLRSSLESGIPTVRNRTSAHGQGSEISEVPSYLASYLLHLTATIILLLADAEKSLA